VNCMKIAIVGAGAMGCLFGGRLSLAGEEVWLLDVRKDIVTAISERGLVISTAENKHIAHPRVTTDPMEIGQVDLIIICVKATATRTAAQSVLPLLGPSTLVLTLQNGYGNAEILAETLGTARIIAGTTAQGATLLAPGRILHAGFGETYIGEMQGCVSPHLQAVAALLSKADMETTTTNDLTSLLWGKLIVNVGINALTGITGLTNGELAQSEEMREIMAASVAEAVAVAHGAGIKLPYVDPFGKVLSVAYATANNRSSMLQDLDRGHATEIDAINGAIVREGARVGVDTPINRTLFLLIKAAEIRHQ
jgi:2-dehydropantoate 2-reductase